MSTGTPDPSGSEDPTSANGAAAGVAGSATGAASGSGGGGGKPSGKYWAIFAVVALALGIGGFFIGQSAMKANYEKGKAEYDKIYNAGFASGQASGNAAGKAAGQKLGQAQGEQIGKKAGLIAGTKAGEAAGQQAGYASGLSAGIQKGALAALGGLSGWNTNVPYVVELDPSPVPGVPYQIYSRTLMNANTYYFLCPNGSSVCTSPLVK